LKLTIVSVGKQHESYVKEGVDQFTKRTSHYYPIEWKLIPPSKLSEPLKIKKRQQNNVTNEPKPITHPTKTR